VVSHGCSWGVVRNARACGGRRVGSSQSEGFALNCPEHVPFFVNGSRHSAE
jgi:hypothetical protein